VHRAIIEASPALALTMLTIDRLRSSSLQSGERVCRMGLRDRFRKHKSPGREAGGSPSPSPSEKPARHDGHPAAASQTSPDPYQELKSQIHRKLIESVDLSDVNLSESDAVVAEIRRILADMIETENLPLGSVDREKTDRGGSARNLWSGAS